MTKPTLQAEVIRILGETLELGERTAHLTAATSLAGAMPELDSMAIINVIVELEEHFDVFFENDEVTAETFDTVASLTALVEGKLETRV